LQLLEHEIYGVALFLEGHLLQNHLHLQPVVMDLVASHSIFCDLQLVVGCLCLFSPSFARPEDFHGQDGPDNLICIKSRRVRGFHPHRESTLVCNFIYRWLLTDEPTAMPPYYITVTVWLEIFVRKPRIRLLPARVGFPGSLVSFEKMAFVELLGRWWFLVMSWV
jgi:hypothetical protein